VGSVLLIFAKSFCAVFSLLYVFVLCIVYPVLSVSGLSILDYPSVFSNLCIVYPVLSVSGLSIFDCPSVFSNLCSVYCVPIVVGFLDCSFLIAPSVFSNLYYH
jgi:hypothetical protein